MMYERRRTKFFGRVIKIKQLFYRTLIFVLAAIILISVLACITQSQNDFFDTQRLLGYLKNTVLYFEDKKQTKFQYNNYYKVLNQCITSIKSSDEMSKKYAALYGGVIKKNNSGKEKEEPILHGNVLEKDMSAKGISFNNATDYNVSAEELLNAPLLFSVNPTVLIVHTHTSEAYSESTDFRSEDVSKNVVRVGEELSKKLKEKGVLVVHDKTQNDNPSYNKSYKKCLSVIEQNLTKNPNIEIVIDIHRDYTKTNENIHLKPTASINNKKSAQIMFVMGTDSMDLYHPEWRHNLSFAVKIQNELNKKYPTLCRAINIRTERFNQHVTKGSMIIEVGAASNSVEEAAESAKYIGEAIAAVLQNR